MTDQNADAITLKLIEQVQAKRDEIAKVNRPQWKTNCKFTFSTNDKSINLHVESNPEVLTCMAAALLSHQAYYAQAATLLGLKPSEATWDGSPVSDWIDDIKARLAKITVSEKKASLKKLEDRLNLIISPELKRQMELEAIQKELNE